MNFKRRKVVIQYPYIPLYRVPIFRELTKSKQYEYEFWAHEVSPDKYLKTAFIESGLPVVKTPLRTFKFPFLKYPLEIQFSSIHRILRTLPDVFVIMATPYSLTTWLSMIVARILGCVVLNWTHGFLKDEKGLKGYIRSLFYKIPHGHLLYGNKARDIMIKKGFDRKKLDVIYNSLNYRKQSNLRDILNYEDRLEVRKRLNIPENAIVLITIGRLMKKLKIDKAIEGAKKLNDSGQNTFLIVVGDGPDKDRLLHKSLSLNISDKIIFYGSCYEEEELSKLFNISDLCVVMGKVGLSAVHSLGYGIPVITNNNLESHFPEIEAIIEDETGWFFEEDNVESFSKKIKKIDYRGKYYKNCIRVIEKNYTPEMQAKYIENAIGKYIKEE